MTWEIREIVPDNACSAFSRREGSLISRLIRLRLKGSIFGGKLLWCAADPPSEDLPGESTAVQDTSAGLELDLLPGNTGLLLDWTCGETTCNGRGIIGAIATTISLSVPPSLPRLSLPCTSARNTATPSKQKTSLWMQVRRQRESRNGREQSREQQSATKHEEMRNEDEEAKAKRRRRREEGGRAGGRARNGNFTEGQAKRTVPTY